MHISYRLTGWIKYSFEFGFDFLLNLKICHLLVIEIENLYKLVNNPDTHPSSIPFHDNPTVGEQLYNEYISEKIQKKEEKEAQQLKDEKKVKKGVRFDDTTLIDPQESLSNSGLKAGGGGFLENFLNIVAPYTPEHDPKTGNSIYG